MASCTPCPAGSYGAGGFYGGCTPCASQNSMMAVTSSEGSASAASCQMVPRGKCITDPYHNLIPRDVSERCM